MTSAIAGYLIVKHDEQGVAGFFEDLPVLLIILAGTFTIVTSSLSISMMAWSIEDGERMDRIADECADVVLSDILNGGSGEPVTVDSICSTRLLHVAEQFLGSESFRVSVVMVHPGVMWLFESELQGVSITEGASTASRLFNALTGDGLSAILVVRLIVW